jgi:hypothetical protein
VIKPTESNFILGKNITKEFVVLHETIHESHRKKLDGVLSNINLEMAYDKVK